WPLLCMAPLACTLALLAMTRASAAIMMLPLDMAPMSFDDQYQGCRSAMMEALPALNRSEFQQNPLFAKAWKAAAAEWRSRGSRVSPLSFPAQAIALLAYTMTDLYKEFNPAVRKAGCSPWEYRDKFHFKMLHFLLTDALATLRVTQGRQCHHVFRGVGKIQFKAQKGDMVRFGQFASTSLSKDVSQEYGTDTMFQVYTCQGVDIQDFSYDKSKKEVLIPPFETFKVTDVTKEGGQVQIWLSSTGTHSKYNCTWLKGDIMGTTWRAE
ncbi:NRT2 ribosyltransferase, partial [Grantiella picta]|nr:NRT2 ribosyltransferase [Grantiella picta]